MLKSSFKPLQSSCKSSSSCHSKPARMDGHRCASCHYPTCCTPRQPQCGRGPCTEPLIIVGAPMQWVPEKPTCSSNMAAKYTKPPEIIQEEPNMESLFLADSTLQCAPLHVRQLFKHFTVHQLSQPHVLFMLIYILALESGFVTENLFGSVNRALPKIPPFYTYHSKYVTFCCRQRPQYKLDELNESYFTVRLRVYYKGLDDPKLNSLLVAVVSGEVMIVTILPSSASKLTGRSTSLSIPRYVVSKLSSRKPFHQYFRNLAELAAQMRDDIFVPIRNEQLQLLNAAPTPSLLGLTPSIRDRIYDKLNEQDLNVLKETSKVFIEDLEDRDKRAVTDESEQSEVGESTQEEEDARTEESVKVSETESVERTVKATTASKRTKKTKSHRNSVRKSA